MFASFLWLWHLPAPYDATLHSDAIYWTMHVTLFGSAVLLWRELLALERRPFALVAAGTVASMQMGFLGAVLTLAGRPLFAWHYLTTEAWGFTPLADQQLGGALMWVPGGVLFLWLALRTLAHALRDPSGRLA
jgi:putative membrane protein